MYPSIILFAIVSYLLGSIPTGVVLAKFFSTRDIRKAGSGNIGATNVTRVIGKRLGVLTFAGDVAKGFFPVYAGERIFDSIVPVPLSLVRLLRRIQAQGKHRVSLFSWSSALLRAENSPQELLH